MRDKRIYIKSIAISERDLNYIKRLKIQEAKSFAGVLAFIINFYRKMGKKKTSDLE